MGKKSKSKGSAFERLICVQLSMWISGGKRKDLFWRSAMSGGRATIFRKRADVEVRNLKAQVGDVSAVADGPGMWLTEHFMIECKHYKDLHMNRLFFQDTQMRAALPIIWKELSEDATHYNKHPMGFFRQMNYPQLICLDKAGFELLTVVAIDPIPPPLVMYPYLDLYMWNSAIFFSSVTIKPLDIPGIRRKRKRMEEKAQPRKRMIDTGYRRRMED